MNVYKNNEDFWRDPNDRRNVWDFSYYAFTVFYYILSDYFSLIKIPEEETKYKLLPHLFNDDYKNISERIVQEYKPLHTHIQSHCFDTIWCLRLH